MTNRNKHNLNDNCHENENWFYNTNREILKSIHGKNDMENKKYEKIYGGM